MIRFALFLTLCLFAICGSANAYTAQDRAACEGDARHLCTLFELLSAAGGSYANVIACFHREHAKLSPACREAVARYRDK